MMNVRMVEVVQLRLAMVRDTLLEVSGTLSQHTLLLGMVH